MQGGELLSCVPMPGTRVSRWRKATTRPATRQFAVDFCSVTDAVCDAPEVSLHVTFIVEPG